MSEKFEREERYLVVKLSKLADDQGDNMSRSEKIFRIAHFGKALVNAVVVEEGWPEHAPVWQMIERRMSGKPAVTAAEELEAVLYWRRKHDQAIKERDALQERLNAADQRADDLETQLAATEQSRRAWFDSSQAADKRIDGLTGASSRAAADIVAERQRQITAEGYKPDRDDCYSFGELALAAAGYAASAGGARSIGRQLFRWDDAHWKPSTPRRDLVKSGALILAEIERIDRAAITNFPL